MDIGFSKLASLDLKMLRTLLVLIETKNVSQAAEYLGLQQSTVSYQLGKLRITLDDPLLIRSSRGFEPTAFSTQIQPILTAQLQQLEDLLFATEFEPKQAQGTIKIACHRNGPQRLIKSLLSLTNKYLPLVRIDTLDLSEQSHQLIRESAIDFAIGFAPEQSSQLVTEPLLKLNYQVVMSNQHPQAEQELTESEVFNYPHVVVNANASVERWLWYLAEKKSDDRVIALSSSSMEYAAMSLMDTERIMFVADTQNRFFEQYDVCVQRAPYIPPQTVSLMFHERSIVDPLKAYFKTLIETAKRESLVDLKFE